MLLEEGVFCFFLVVCLFFIRAKCLAQSKGKYKNNSTIEEEAFAS